MKESRFSLAFFWGEIRRMRRSLAEVGLAAVGLQLMGLATPLFFQIIIDKVVGYHSETTLHMLTLGMLAAIVLEAGFGWLRSYLLLFATSVIDLRLSIRIFERLSGLGLPFFERHPAGVLIKHMQQPEKIRNKSSMPVRASGRPAWWRISGPCPRSSPCHWSPSGGQDGTVARPWPRACVSVWAGWA